ELQSRYPHRLVVLGFPCNQFGYQENGSDAEILNSLKYVRPGEGYKPAFTIFEKCIVNGSDAHPEPKYLVWNPICRNDISWNFEKFLIGPEGEPFKRYKLWKVPLKKSLQWKYLNKILINTLVLA
uniref:Glutathione peroxidase n=1 Tax=Cyprinus carpio TaxID=7962 RepID=A0A8C1TYA2_CYPCA